MKQNHPLKSRRLFKLLILLAVLLCPWAPPESGDAAEAQVLIIAHGSVQEDSLSLNEIQNIFLGRKTQWSGGAQISFAIIEADEAHERLLKAYIKKTGAQFRAYWKQRVFSGEGEAPRKLKDQAEMIAFVAATEGALGYILQQPLDETKVKRIAIK